jgi:hypothetical protein
MPISIYADYTHLILKGSDLLLFLSEIIFRPGDPSSPILKYNQSSFNYPLAWFIVVAFLQGAFVREADQRGLDSCDRSARFLFRIV